MAQIQYRRFAICIMMGSFALIVSACATARPTGAHQTNVECEAVVTVESIDVPNRLVTVRGATGESFSFYVDKSVEGFPQAGVGDRVRVRFTESFMVQLRRPGESEIGIESSTETARSRPGQPSGSTATEVKATVRIEKVASNGKFVTFTGPRGRRTIEILDPSFQAYVKKLRPGDNVEATYMEALALSLEKVKQ